MSKIVNIDVFKSTKKHKDELEKFDAYIKVIDLAAKALSFYKDEKMAQKIVSSLLYYKTCAILEKDKLVKGNQNEKV